ncbi:YqiA/YcfP family alpha/beta fold hydrolase [Psychromonas sp.]|uniref:YqiA/YcfP family alpha/beta fold hydrolase n=1 Tax=Psychromonas sp. TaxID=1884585 RepID=UPI00356AFD83
MAKVLLSLHGFHSSPGSLKAQQMDSYLAEHYPEITFLCPQLPCLPKQMWEVIESVFAQYSGAEIAVMGSSLGGYLAAKAGEQYGVKVVLINPAVFPYRLLEQYAGTQIHPYTQESYQINENYLQQLTALDTKSQSNPEKCWLLLQKQDEVLNYREALNKYQRCKITCEEGGDHSFIGFERFLPAIIAFLF